MPTLFLKGMEDVANTQIRKFQRPEPGLKTRRSCKKRLRMCRNNLYCEKLESLPYISAADSMGLCLLIFTQLFLKVKRSESRSAGRKQIWHEIATKVILGHSFCNPSGPTRGSISSYNIAGLISEVSEEVATQIAKNCRCQQPHSHLKPPSRGTLASIGIYTLYFQKLESLIYIFFVASMGLQTLHVSSFKFMQWAPKDSSFLQQSAFWQFKVIQGRWFWYQSKARMRLPICHPLWLWSYLAPFLRYGDLLAKNCVFFSTPLSFGAIAPYVPCRISRWS